MPVPSRSANFADLLDSRFAKVFDNRYKQLPDMLPRLYDVVSGGAAPTRDTYRQSQVGTFGDIPEFTGTVVYDDVAQGYDSTITPKEYASGFQVERKLWDDDLTGIMDAKPAGLATAYQRTRQKHGASTFNNAFSVDTTWNNNTENVALCSDSHTTTAAGVSTSSGFDNLVTSALSAVALASARIQMVNFRGDRAERIAIMPNTILIPPDLYQAAFEIVQSAGLPDTANNNANVHEGKYTVIEWNYASDVNNWFLIDSIMMKDALKWVDRTAKEFAMVEDFDSLIGKWRLYSRYGLGHSDWRWILGASVS
jgi:phage major head subunit gpT-like protein